MKNFKKTLLTIALTGFLCMDSSQMNLVNAAQNCRTITLAYDDSQKTVQNFAMDGDYIYTVACASIKEKDSGEKETSAIFDCYKKSTGAHIGKQTVHYVGHAESAEIIKYNNKKYLITTSTHSNPNQIDNKSTFDTPNNRYGLNLKIFEVEVNNSKFELKNPSIIYFNWSDIMGVKELKSKLHIEANNKYLWCSVRVNGKENYLRFDMKDIMNKYKNKAIANKIVVKSDVKSSVSCLKEGYYNVFQNFANSSKYIYTVVTDDKKKVPYIRRNVKSGNNLTADAICLSDISGLKKSDVPNMNMNEVECIEYLGTSDDKKGDELAIGFNNSHKKKYEIQIIKAVYEDDNGKKTFSIKRIY